MNTSPFLCVSSSSRATSNWKSYVNWPIISILFSILMIAPNPKKDRNVFWFQSPERRHTAEQSDDWHLWVREDGGWTTLLSHRLGLDWNVWDYFWKTILYIIFFPFVHIFFTLSHAVFTLVGFPLTLVGWWTFPCWAPPEEDRRSGRSRSSPLVFWGGWCWWGWWMMIALVGVMWQWWR